MSRYTGPSCRQCRAEGVKLMLKGERCGKAKCAIERGKANPGVHTRRGKLSDYGEQLRAKQKLRRHFGISERQFSKMFAIAASSPGVTSATLVQLLERRLDNVVYRLGMAPSRPAARQVVTHGHVKVNGRRVNIASFFLKPNDVIQLKDSPNSKALVAKSREAAKGVIVVPAWLAFDDEAMKAQVLRLPDMNEIPLPDGADPQMVVELYSK